MGMEGASSGLVGSAEGARSKVPLRDELIKDFSARKGRNEPPWASLGGANGFELAIVPFRSGFESPLVERMALQLEKGEREEGWSSSCLATFNHCLGMPTEGFEEEILYLLRRMKGRIEIRARTGRIERRSLRLQNPARN